MNEILRRLESLQSRVDPNGKTKVGPLGVISCGNTVHLRHVPFYEPCVILVLGGRKTLFARARPIECDAGTLIAVPAGSAIDLRNEPDARSGRYRALILPFGRDLLARACGARGLRGERLRARPEILTMDCDEQLRGAVLHYLDPAADGKLLEHRLMEVLLILLGRDPRLAAYALDGTSWADKVRLVVATDLARAWSIRLVCARLAASESTLRRHLRNEKTGFREVLQEQRLASALMQLLQTSLPVSRIALDCGYQSVSRFSSNFRRRFGVSPSRLQDSGNGSSAPLSAAVREHRKTA